MIALNNRAIYTGKDICAVIPTAGKRMQALSRALTSVLKQSEMCGEIIVVWDSPSNPPDDLRREGAVKVIHIKNNSKGVAGARNSAILETNLAFIALLDDDDYWLPQKISKYVEAINSSPNASFYLSRAEYLDERGNSLGVFPSKKYRHGVALSSYLNNNIRIRRRRVSIPTSSYVFPRLGKNGVNLFDESIFLAEDLLLLLRLEQSLQFQLVGSGALSVTTIYKQTEEGLSRRPIIFSDWMKIHEKYFSFLGSREFDNATLYFGLRHYRQSSSLTETITWFLKNCKSNADLITILSSILWIISNESLSILKRIIRKRRGKSSSK
jgi:glycosyltransferase involved in cell wall biosynthesis